MKGKKITKLMLDIILTVLFITLIYPRDTGFTFHEIAGLSISVLFLVHIGLNWSWFKNITINIFNPRLKSKPRLFYLMDCISFIAVAAIIVTGVMISQVLFPSQDMISHTVVVVHKWISYFCLVWFGLHIVLHWRFLAETIPQLFRSPAKPAWSRTALRLASIVLILGLLYSQFAAGSKEDKVYSSQEPALSSSQHYSRHRGHQDLTTSSSDGESDSYDVSNSNPDPSTESQSSETPGISVDNGSSSTSDQDSISSGDSSGDTGDQVSLSDFLGKMFCTGCEKHCSLLALRCDRGLPQLEAAKQQYQATYGSDSVN